MSAPTGTNTNTDNGANNGSNPAGSNKQVRFGPEIPPYFYVNGATGNSVRAFSIADYLAAPLKQQTEMMMVVMLDNVDAAVKAGSMKPEMRASVEKMVKATVPGLADQVKADGGDHFEFTNRLIDEMMKKVDGKTE